MKWLIYVVLVVLLASCSRKVTKDSHKVKITQERKTDSVGVRVDLSTTTVIERIDTVATTPARTITQEVPMNMDSLINGMTAIKNELIDVLLHLNPVTGILSATARLKPQSIPLKFDRVTTKQNNITEQSRKQEAVLNRVNSEVKRKEVDKEPIKLWWLAALLLLAGVSWVFWRRR